MSISKMQATSLIKLRDLIPVTCPLIVTHTGENFQVRSLDGRVDEIGRFQIIAVAIRVYVTCWAGTYALELVDVPYDMARADGVPPPRWLMPLSPLPRRANGHRLRFDREDQRWSLAECARFWEVSVETLEAIEANRQPCPGHLLESYHALKPR